MALFKKHKTEPVPPEDTGAHDTSVGTAADVEAVMKKYDRESNTRVWEGLPRSPPTASSTLCSFPPGRRFGCPCSWG